MSGTAITMELLERRMARIMIEVDEQAANSTVNALERAFYAELVGAPHSHREEEDEVDDTPPVPAPQDGGDNSSAGKLHAAPRARALRMDLASCYLPDHDEDAHFGHPKAGFLGVADGVGSFRRKGVDAAAFARALMQHALAAAKQAVTQHGRRSNPVVISPYSLLMRAYLKAARAGATGASTAVIVSLRGATLGLAYVGDSAFAVLRGGKMVHRSAPQQHYFNCPHQLRAGGGDRVADAAVGEMPVAEGDVVVVGTDGLFDNVFDMELERVVRTGTELGLSPQSLADKIAAAASKMSRSPVDALAV